MTLMRLQWWPSAASAAFLLSGLEVFTFLPYWLLRWRLLENMGPVFPVPLGITYMSLFVIAGIGLAAEATVMWGISRQQQRCAPVIARLSQLGILAYVAGSVLLMLLIGSTGFGPWPSSAIGAWVFQLPKIPRVVSFGLLGWASRDGNNALQRWASAGLIIVALLGCLSVGSTLFEWPTGTLWPWLAALHVGIRACVWMFIGAWLRAATAGSS